MKIALWVSFSAIIVSALQSRAQAELVSNNDFNYSGSAWWVTYQEAMTGWEISNVIHQYSFPGRVSRDAGGIVQFSGGSMITQLLDTTPGQSYNFTIWMLGGSVTPYWDEVPLPPTRGPFFVPEGENKYYVTATKPKTSITIRGGSELSWVDGVSVIPEPSMFALYVAGLALLTLTHRGAINLIGSKELTQH